MVQDTITIIIDPDQPSLRCLMFKYAGPPRVGIEDASARVEEGLVLLETPFVDDASPIPRAPGVAVELLELYFCDFIGAFNLNLKDFVRFMMLPMFEETNVMGWSWRKRLKYLTSTMTALTTFGKSTYVIQAPFFDKGYSNRSD